MDKFFNMQDIYSTENIFVAVGLLGQAVFFMRFFVQWLASERAKKSVVPVTFWIFSIIGASILLTYAIYRNDPVFTIGQSCGFFIYTRNLYLIYREKKRARAAAEVKNA